MASSVTKYETRSPDNEKTKKYDRQLRLWGDHGQSSLENAHVCLINATAAGTEALKGLVLPGIGAFTIVDGHLVSGEDVGSNFFLTKDSIGSNRGKAACALLVELNPHVQGDYVDEDCEKLLRSNPQFFISFSIVIATGLSETCLRRLSQLLHSKRVPLIVCRVYGLIGYIRLQVSEHTVLEAHPDDDFEDLRLTCPFPELRDYVDSIDFQKLNRGQHAHVPYVVILIKALDLWQAKHGAASLPTYKDKKEFEDLINSLKYQGPDDSPPVEPLNFDEAIKARVRSIRLVYVPSTLQALFKDPLCENLTPESKPFWIMLRALRNFVDRHGSLPLRGSIPDMVSDSDSYRQLASVYKHEADKHFQEIWKTIGDILTDLGKPEDTLCEPEVRIMCKNAHTLTVIRTRPLYEEFDQPNVQAIVDTLQEALQPDEPDIVYYILLRATDKFHEEFKRYPGHFRDQMETDIPKLKAIFVRLVLEWGLGPLNKDDIIHEICRFGASELHTVASIIGGCAAQEAVKIITQQFIPINNTFIFNAISCSSATFEL